MGRMSTSIGSPTVSACDGWPRSELSNPLCKQTLCILCPLTRPRFPLPFPTAPACRLQLLAGAAAGLQVAGGLLGLDLGHPGDTLAQLRALALVRAGLSEEQVTGARVGLSAVNECCMIHRRGSVCDGGGLKGMGQG